MLFRAAPSVASCTLNSEDSEVIDSCQTIAPVPARRKVQSASSLTVRPNTSLSKLKRENGVTH